LAADESGLDYVGVQDHPYQRRFLDTTRPADADGLKTTDIAGRLGLARGTVGRRRGRFGAER